MWKFRDWFCENSSRYLGNLLQEAGYLMKPRVFILGVSDASRTWCEPTSFDIAPYLLKNVCGRARTQIPGWVHADKSDRCYSWLVDDEFKKALHSLVSQCINSIDAGAFETFVTPPVQIEGSSVLAVFQLPKTDCAAAGLRRYGHGCNVGDCFGTAVMEQFVAWALRELGSEHPGANTDSPIVDDLLRAAGKDVVRKTFKSWNYFEAFTEISSMYYERAKVRGTLLLPTRGQISPNLISFPEPIALNRTRNVRKLLEMCDHDQAIVCFGNSVTGMSTRPTSPSNMDVPYEVHFSNQHEWRLQYAFRTLMTVSLGRPTAPKIILDDAHFDKILDAVFESIQAQQKLHLLSLVKQAISGGHGTTLVISSEAENEALRLGSQSTRTNPVYLTPQLFQQVSRIDGAVLCSPNGECHSIGVILDGPATNIGDSARGSRYNSAVRYVDFRRRCIAVVVSDDGMVDVIRPEGSLEDEQPMATAPPEDADS